MLCISAVDSAVGVDTETQARIFDPFLTARPPGMGTELDTAMIYGLTKQRKGRRSHADAVSVESDL
ncbi:MAG: hypothetical protein ACE5PT_05105 [Gemmatimonadales bacterium]